MHNTQPKVLMREPCSRPQSPVRESFKRALLRALLTDPRGRSVATAHGARVISASAAALGEGSRAERRLPVQGLRAIGGVFPISLDRSMSKDNTANVEYSFLGDGVCARTHPAPAPCNARERLVGGRSGLVANSGVGRRMGCTDPNFTLCWPPEIRNKARDSDGKVQ